MKKTALILILTLLLLALVPSCGQTPPAPEDNTVAHVGALLGPTGMGMAKLMLDEKDTGKYVFSTYSAPTDAVNDLASGELDMLCMPTNTAATLANKNSNYITVLCVNTLGSLFLITDENTEVRSIADLEGKTIYTSVATSTTNPIVQYLLDKNHVNATIETVADHDALVASVVKGEVSIAVLPEPKVSAALMQAKTYSIALNLSEEWDKVSDRSLTMGCLVVRNDFLSAHKTVVDRFLAEYRTSVDYINTAAVDDAAQVIVDAGILPKLPVAKSALTHLKGSLVCLTGKDMKAALVSFYGELLTAMPASIGNKLPVDDFYYIPDEK